MNAQVVYLALKLADTRQRRVKRRKCIGQVAGQRQVGEGIEIGYLHFCLVLTTGPTSEEDAR